MSELVDHQHEYTCAMISMNESMYPAGRMDSEYLQALAMFCLFRKPANRISQSPALNEIMSSVRELCIIETHTSCGGPATPVTTVRLGRAGWPLQPRAGPCKDGTNFVRLLACHSLSLFQGLALVRDIDWLVLGFVVCEVPCCPVTFGTDSCRREEERRQH